MKHQSDNFYGSKSRILRRSPTQTMYQMDCDTTNGYMTCYHLFPGIDLAYTSFEAASCNMRSAAIPHVLEIAYCCSGRFECKYKNDYFTYLGEGDFAVSVLSPEQESASFPMGSYEGFAIIADMKKTGSRFENVVEGVSIDLQALVEKFCSHRCCSVIKAEPQLAHVFNEIYDARNLHECGYLRLKVLEVFYLLAKLLPDDHVEVYKYYSAAQIQKIKAIKAELMENLDEKESLRSIAERYGMSLTSLKDCFKAVYGKPIYAFQREFKMQKATKLLIETDLSILEIAGQLGYETPNKFSTAFKSVIGMAPREYRKQRK